MQRILFAVFFAGLFAGCPAKSNGTRTCYDNNGNFEADDCRTSPDPNARRPGFTCYDRNGNGQIDDCDGGENAGITCNDDRCCVVRDSATFVDDCIWRPGKVPAAPIPFAGDKTCVDTSTGRYCCRVEDRSVFTCTWDFPDRGTPAPAPEAGKKCFDRIGQGADRDGDGLMDYCCELASDGALSGCIEVPNISVSDGGGQCKADTTACAHEGLCCSNACDADGWCASR